MHGHVTDLLQTYGYAALFLLVALESMGIPLPGETALVTAAALAASGRLAIGEVFLTASVAAVVGDSAGYWIGRKGGLPLVRRYGRLVRLREAHLDQAHTFFARHGAKAVFLGRFVALLRTWAAVLAGAAHMPYPAFLFYNVAGGVIWALLFSALGYTFGRSLPRLERYLGQASLAAALAVALAAAGYLGLYWFRAHRERLADRASHTRPSGANLKLHLMVGLLVSLTALGVFAAITEDVVNHDPLTEFDVRVFQWFGDHGGPPAKQAAAGISVLGSAGLIATLALGMALVLGTQRRWTAFGVWLAAVGGAELLTEALKRAIQRPRPPMAAEFLHNQSFSFPSGHALVSLVVYGLLAYLVASIWLRRRWMRAGLIASAGSLVLLIGVSRLYLGVHYFSDVVGGYAAGSVWLTVCITGLELRRRPPAASEPPE